MSGWVVVTGVSGGIGTALAELVRESGYQVLGVDRRPPKPDTCDDFLEFDLRSWRAIGSVLSERVDGRSVVGLANNAAVQPVASISEISDDDIAATLDVNVACAAAMIRSLAPHLAQSQGAVVNVSSVHALATSAGMSIYAASKAALLALTRGSALDLAPNGIRVNAVVPGAIDSGLLHAHFEAQGLTSPEGLAQLAGQTPLGRVGNSRDVAQAVLFLLDHQRSGFMTGQAIVVDGGVSAQLASGRAPGE